VALPGLLIEYLVNGAIAFAWLFPLLHSRLPAIDPPLYPAAALLLYVLGMAVDFLAFFLTRRAKHWLRKRVARRLGITNYSRDRSGILRQAKIALYAPELAKELALRSSRDRIARGLLLNAIFATAFLLPLCVGVPVVVFAALLWLSFEAISFAYELYALQLVEERLNREAPKHVA
jgi:hypothetical protein